MVSASRMTSPTFDADWAARAPDPFPPLWASAWGDDECGLWAEFKIKSTTLPALIQRMRWVEAGRFLMGSPEDEHQRRDNEGPQHWVTISQGFWLADTACTQALWQAVMGNNPSRFNERNQGGPAHPVEQVSWLDIQPFLVKLNDLLADCQVTLPTEAEWEYACRADTTTPFWFGEDINTDQVNYRGDFPYRGGKKELFRQQTVTVKALAQNGWGLYQMHGNVWEWCADRYREYDEKAVSNLGLGAALKPNIADEGVRAVRGGGWLSDAQFARCAYRYLNQPDRRSGYLGFRFALRSRHQ